MRAKRRNVQLPWAIYNSNFVKKAYIPWGTNMYHFMQKALDWSKKQGPRQRRGRPGMGTYDEMNGETGRTGICTTKWSTKDCCKWKLRVTFVDYCSHPSQRYGLGQSSQISWRRHMSMGFNYCNHLRNEKKLEERRGPQFVYYKRTEVQQKRGSKSFVLIVISGFKEIAGASKHWKLSLLHALLWPFEDSQFNLGHIFYLYSRFVSFSYMLTRAEGLVFCPSFLLWCD